MLDNWYLLLFLTYSSVHKSIVTYCYMLESKTESEYEQVQFFAIA